MRRLLDPSKVGGIPSTIEFDKDGNRKVKKNLDVGGKLTLDSLVSDTNPDGDITKELGGGGGTESHCYRIKINSYCWFLSYTTKNYGYRIGENVNIPNDFFTNTNYNDLRSIGYHPAAGAIILENRLLIVGSFKITNNEYIISGYYNDTTQNIPIEMSINITTKTLNIVQLS